MILVANHSSYLDPILIGLANRRRIRYMAKAELFPRPVLGRLVTKLGAFPVRREIADRRAIRISLDLLARGEIVLLFPEGTRYWEDGALGPVQPGAGVIAEKAQCPIVPVAIVGAKRIMPPGVRLPRFPKLSVVVGTPLMPSPVADGAPEVKRRGRELIERAMADVQRMIDEVEGPRSTQANEQVSG